jgi:tripeptidyl-peptidase-1
VSGFIEQFANMADLKVTLSRQTRRKIDLISGQQFLTQLRPDISSSTTFALQTLDGGVNTQTRADAGIEAVRFFTS